MSDAPLVAMKAKLERLAGLYHPSVIRPGPWKDEKGIWREPNPTALMFRLRSGDLCVDGEIHDEDVGLSDDLFRARIIDPCLAALTQPRPPLELPK